MAGQPQVLQQPDFNRIQQCHLDLASELNKCRNIPSLDQGAAILNEIRLLREDVNKIHARLSAADANSIARLANSLLVAPDAYLQPLIHVETNQPIDRFPGTPQDIQTLTSPIVNSILRALGASTQGTLDARRRILRLQIGLKADPV